MTIRIYGDVAIDNYEYEFTEDFSSEYWNNLKTDNEGFPYPALINRTPNRFVARHFGGAYLLERGIAMALTVWGKDFEKDKNQIITNLKPWKTHFNSLKGIRERLTKEPGNFFNFLNIYYRLTKNEDGSYRIKNNGYSGFTLPNSRNINCQFIKHLDYKEEINICDGILPHNIFLFNDCATELRNQNIDSINKLIGNDENNNSWIIIKTNDLPVAHAKNLETSSSELPFYNTIFALETDRKIFIIDAQDLRRAGLPITRSLSWGRPIKDIVQHIENKKIKYLPNYFIITFDYDASALFHLDNSGDNITVKEVSLLFSVNRSEGEFQAGFEGSMPGAQSIFTSALTASIYQILQENQSLKLDSEEAEFLLTYSLIAKQRVLKCGFSPVNTKNMFEAISQENDIKSQFTNLTFHESVFALPAQKNTNNEKKEEERLADSIMPPDKQPDVFDNPYVRGYGENKRSQLRKDQERYGLTFLKFKKNWLQDPEKELFDVLSADFENADKAYIDYVRSGKIKDSSLPLCNIGKIKTISRKEIESLRAIRRLIKSYVADGRRGPTPIGLAVFGPPGAGKGFTVKSVFATFQGRAKELTTDSSIECNLAGLSNPEDITPFFHQARDFGLRGKVPVLFFDEFDCSVGNEKLFWLKRFLAPLQDGAFSSGHMTHPIGKSIFIFAGGTTHSFEKFKEAAESDPATKGTDFLSRLQAHIDVQGLAPPEEEHFKNWELFKKPEARKFAMKRAIVLRDLLYLRAKHLFSGEEQDGKANIDENVAAAFIHEQGYVHGVRSMEAVIRMSALDDTDRFSAECLPTAQQLKMHVSEDFHAHAFGKPIRRGILERFW
ncbi:AAA family ATPase [Rhizobiales bacterium]|uniref:AAA family ATPase n=1 Tax=Hongsoonwoonella zoysiae TaxID=2821844 RepID=UPI00155F7D93|nr:AAA family ATPase [Hongsoonwoonella zoysiae]NRG17908.1 AAA family ATPase [Hongsoonwoonella zoysiae]